MNSMTSLSKYLPYIFEGSLWSLGLVLGGLGIGFMIGVMFSLIEVYNNSPLKKLISLYVWFFRGTPLIVQLFLFHWSIFPALGIKSTPLTTSITVLGLRSGAYQSQILRGAIGSIEETQMLAAKAVGMNDWDAISSIILPQALRIALPQISNEYSIILKDSAICFILGVMELMTRAKYTAIATGIALIPYLVAGLIYMGLTYIGTKLFDLIYLKMKIPGSVEG